MDVVVNIYGPERHIVSDSRVALELPQDAVFEDIFHLLADKYGDSFREAIFNSRGELNPTVEIFVNQERIDNLKEPVRGEEVKVFILSPVAGG